MRARLALALLAAVALCVPLAGCVDVQWARDRYFDEPPAPPVYANRTVVLIDHAFPQALGPQDTYQPRELLVRPGANSLTFDVQISINSGRTDASAQLRVTAPDGTVWYDARHTQSTTAGPDPAVRPMAGLWHVEVWARGYGEDPSTTDGFSVSVTVDQPIA